MFRAFWRGDVLLALLRDPGAVGGNRVFSGQAQRCLPIHSPVVNRWLKWLERTVPGRFYFVCFYFILYWLLFLVLHICL